MKCPDCNELMDEESDYFICLECGQIEDKIK